MATLRAFIACELSQKTKGLLSSVISELKQLSGEKYKWVPLENIHITLKFIGNIDFDKFKILTEKLRPIITTVPEMECELGDFGVFPKINYPRIFWIGIKSPPSMTELVTRIELESSNAGIPPDHRQFSPHLTLFRIPTEFERIPLRSYMESIPQSLLRFTCLERISNVTFFQSTLTPSGAIYTPLTRVPLCKNPLPV